MRGKNARAPLSLSVSDKMIENFDIDFVVSNFQVTNLKYYLDLLREASNADLRHFRREVKRHKKHNRQHQAFTNVKKFSTHDAIIAAINHELLKRSFYYSLFKFSCVSGLPLSKHSRVLNLKSTNTSGHCTRNPNIFIIITYTRPIMNFCQLSVVLYSVI